MSNAITVPDAFNGPIAPIFGGAAPGDDLSGGITGGYGLIKYRGKVWSIHYRQQDLTLMRDDGDGPRGSIDVVIVKANAQLSKTYYINGWDENNTNPPDCASANGIVPDQGVPHPQSNVCATCPKNAWGSAPNGGKGKACGDHRRMAAVPLADIRNESLGGALLLRCPAASLQDLAAFDNRYRSLGYPYFAMGIKIGFDPAESFPKFTFQAIRPLTQAEGELVMAMRSSPEVARVVSEGTAPVAAVAGAQATFLEAPPPDAVQPQQVQVRPAPAPEPVVAQPQPAAVVQPAPAPVVRPQPPAQPATAQPVAPAAAGGFGPAAGVAQPTDQRPTQPAQRAATAMTGFGAAGPATPPAASQQVTPQVVQPAAAPVSPQVVSEFEGSIDERLAALLSTQ